MRRSRIYTRLEQWQVVASLKSRLPDDCKREGHGQVQKHDTTTRAECDFRDEQK